jgi:tetratricopeptide (TPR) repeat protein
LTAALLALLALQAAPPQPLLVLPPDTAGDDVPAARAAEAVSDLLPHALAFLELPAVARADRLLALQALDVPPVTLTRASAIRIAEALQAERMVVGRLELQGDEVRLSLRLLDVQRGTLSAPFVAEGGHARLPELVDDLAWDIALASARSARTQAELKARRRTPLPEAVNAYVMGLQGSELTQRVRSLRRALALTPGFDEARLELGRLQLLSRDNQGAYDTLDPVHTPGLARPARFLQGRSLLERGHYREAAALYAGLVARDATPAALNNHALALLRQANPPMPPSEVLRKALELRPADTDIAFNLGFAALVENDPAASAFWLQGIVKQNPRDSHARAMLAWALRRSGRAEEADETWRGVLALAPSLEPLAKEDLTRRFERIAPSELRLAPNENAKSHAELSVMHVARAERALQAGETEAGERELRRATAADPFNPRAHLQLARLLRQRAEFDNAVAELRMALWCREDVSVRVELAQLLKALGRDAEARAEAARALKADPANEAARKLAAGR